MINKLSIVVPYLDVNNTLLNNIVNSLNSQDVSIPIEVILISDCSKYDDIVISYFNNCKFDCVFLKTGRTISTGPGYAKNIGIDSCTGDKILFWDIDDIFTTNKCLEKIVNCFNEKDITALLFCGVSDSSMKKQCTVVDRSFINNHKIRFLDINFGEDTIFNKYIFDFIYKDNLLPMQISDILCAWNYSECNHLYADLADIDVDYCNTLTGCMIIKHEYEVRRHINYGVIDDSDTINFILGKGKLPKYIEVILNSNSPRLKNIIKVFKEEFSL